MPISALKSSPPFCNNVTHRGRRITFPTPGGHLYRILPEIMIISIIIMKIITMRFYGETTEIR